MLSGRPHLWQSKTWLDAKMWSVTFLTVTLDEMDGFWNTSQEAATLVWSSVGLSAQLWLAVSEVVGFCQPFRDCTVSLQTPLVWHHLQDRALVLAPWAIVSWEINGAFSHPTCVNWAIFTRANVSVTLDRILTYILHVGYAYKWEKSWDLLPKSRSPTTEERRTASVWRNYISRNKGTGFVFSGINNCEIT